MQRFFIKKEDIPVIRGEDAHHISKVLRLKTGDKIELLDGENNRYQAKIERVNKGEIICQIIKTEKIQSHPKIKITLAQCLPKHTKMDLIIQKATELGVHEIIPVASERSIAKADKQVRWQKIAKQASQQSGRSYVPNIQALMSFDEIIKLSYKFDLGLIPWELEQEKSLKAVIANLVLAPRNILVIIGPEGGFSHKEAAAAKNSNIIAVSLGKNILRTETAGLAILAMLNYAFEQ